MIFYSRDLIKNSGIPESDPRKVRNLQNAND